MDRLKKLLCLTQNIQTRCSNCRTMSFKKMNLCISTYSLMKKTLLLAALFAISCSHEAETIFYTLNVTTNPINGGSVSPALGEFKEGSSVTLDVAPSIGYQFDSWSGNALGIDTPLTVIMNGNKNIIANFILADLDGDGVVNNLDQCANTPAGQTVNSNGCVISQLDTDGDGVPDDIDQEENTRQGAEVDENGVMMSPIYLDENGVTLKAQSWAIIGDIIEINGIQYRVVNEEQLREKVNNGEDVTTLCISKVTSLRELFFNKSDFNQDIGGWDVSNVKDMQSMFLNATAFNQDISQWDVSNVTTMEGMFKFSNFNQDIGNWNVSSVTDMGSMFRGSFQTGLVNPFNQDISNWNVSNVTNMTRMFQWCDFNQDIGNWDVSSVTDMSSMFRGNFETGFVNSFDQDISFWNVSNVTNMTRMFMQSNFNKDLSDWNVTNVTDCEYIFFRANNWTLPKPNFTNCSP